MPHASEWHFVQVILHYRLWPTSVCSVCRSTFITRALRFSFRNPSRISCKGWGTRKQDILCNMLLGQATRTYTIFHSEYSRFCCAFSAVVTWALRGFLLSVYLYTNSNDPRRFSILKLPPLCLCSITNRCCDWDIDHHAVFFQSICFYHFGEPTRNMVCMEK